MSDKEGYFRPNTSPKEIENVLYTDWGVMADVDDYVALKEDLKTIEGQNDEK